MLAGDVADDVQHLGHVHVCAAFIDDGQGGVHALGEGAGAFDAAGVGADDDEVFAGEVIEGFDEDGGGEEVVDRDVEEALNGGGVEVEGEDAVNAGGFEQAGDEFGGDGDARAVFAILAGIAVVGQNGGDAVGRGAFEGVGHEEDLKEVFFDRGT